MPRWRGEEHRSLVMRQQPRVRVVQRAHTAAAPARASLSKEHLLALCCPICHMLRPGMPTTTPIGLTWLTLIPRLRPILPTCRRYAEPVGEAFAPDTSPNQAPRRVGKPLQPHLSYLHYRRSARRRRVRSLKVDRLSKPA